MKTTAFAVGALLALGTVTGAQAAVVLTLDMSGITSYQQTQNSPCVIGDPSCNNPSGFGSTTLASSTSTYTNVGSPTYTVLQIRNLVGNIFRVGVDVNTTTSPLATEMLDSFSLAINSVTQFLYTGPTQFADNNNGNGRSDALINGFNLTSFAPTDLAQFFVTFHNATDGREEFFLVSSQTPPVPGVPEPASLALLGLGLSALAFARKKKA